MKPACLGILLIALILLSDANATTPEQVVQEQVRAYNARDLDRFLSLYSSDAAVCKLSTGELLGQGKAYFRQRYAERFTSSPDLHATIHDRIVLGDFVIDHEEVVRRQAEPRVSALAVYHVTGSKIDTVWFVFGEGVQLNAAEDTRAAMARHASAVQQRDAATYADTYAPDARIVSLPDGTVISSSREQIMSRVQPFLEGNQHFAWSIEKQIVFGNVVVSLEQQKVGETGTSSRQVVIYEIAKNRISRCWIIPEESR